MAVTKTVIQNSNSRTTIKIVGTAAADTSTITLASDLAFTAGNGTVQTVASPKVNISKIFHSTGGNITLVRNTTTVENLFGTYQQTDYSLAEANDQNIVVTFNTTGGTIILELVKVSGFGDVLPNA